MGGTIKDFYRELKIPFSCKTIELFCGVMIKQLSGGRCLVVNKHGTVKKLLIGDNYEEGDMVYAAMTGTKPYIMDAELYKEAWDITRRAEDVFRRAFMRKPELSITHTVDID